MRVRVLAGPAQTETETMAALELLLLVPLLLEAMPLLVLVLAWAVVSRRPRWCVDGNSRCAQWRGP